ncbi:uncharacterized protein N7477_000302 [Penicillium maclennaniae]|uniref:uncharacterized protein n=1 Tax=Penicillium maclennaniae TaxID=1343394 RepID=UPI002542495F|nr:uncharacterized protein N7477_000302 [Penicillium maclennaniae]KAJ5683957.1 hypothetical protein N7477_000302 [Penicillium maclennaniae]
MYHQRVVKGSPDSCPDSVLGHDINPLDIPTPKKEEIEVGDRDMRLIPRYKLGQIVLIELMGPNVLGQSRSWALRQSLVQKRVDSQNEGFLRSYHPFLRDSKEVFILTQKGSGKRVWVVTGINSTSDDIAGGMDIIVHPSFETPKEPSTLPDPLDREINVDVPLSAEARAMIQGVFPKSVGVSVDKCECVIVRFCSREDMLEAWGFGTPSRIGGMVVGYQVVDTR